METKILVVDDEEEVCKLTQEFLSKQNYKVFAAKNQTEAMDLVKKHRPQLVLLDIRLGEESGMEVLRLTKEFDQNIKVVMVTALDDMDNIRQAKALGADDYLTKPFTTSYLNDFILQKISQLIWRGKEK